MAFIMTRDFNPPYDYYRPLRRHKISETAVPVYDDPQTENEAVPPHSQKPFVIGEHIHNNMSPGNFFGNFGNILSNIAIDDIILIAVIILFLTDGDDRDNVLLIALGFLLINGFGGENKLIG